MTALSMYLCAASRSYSPCSPQITDKSLKKLRSKLSAVKAALSGHRLAGAPDLLQRLVALQAKQALDAAVKIAVKEAKAAQSLIMQARTNLLETSASYLCF